MPRYKPMDPVEYTNIVNRARYFLGPDKDQLPARDVMRGVNKEDARLIKEISYYSGASETLIKMIINGTVTHPNIARRISDEYKLTDEQYLELIPINYRPGPDYDPDKYMDPIDIYLKEKRNKRGVE